MPRLSLRSSPRLAYCAAWALAGTYNFCRDVFFGPVWPLLVYNVCFFTLWALIGLPAVRLIRRVPVTRDLRSWIVHVVAGSAFALVDVVLGEWIATRILGNAPGMSFWQVAADAFRGCFHLALMTYAGLVAVVQGRDAMRLARRRELEVTELEAENLRARLTQLKEQLQPHFLFNTLHGIGSLMHYDVATAERMLNRLGDLLRMTLKDGGETIVPLRQELAFVAAYLEIEQIRFEHRLEVVWAVPDKLQDVLLPSLLLQPLVENAIQHGIAPRAAGGRIVIRARSEFGALVLEVEDDAPTGLPPRKGFGVGLANVRRRLELLYGEEGRLELLREDKGTIARLRVPSQANTAFESQGDERALPAGLQVAGGIA